MSKRHRFSRLFGGKLQQDGPQRPEEMVPDATPAAAESAGSQPRTQLEPPQAAPQPDEQAPSVQPGESAVPAEWQVGDTILDLYEVKDVFTGGGMGLVYRIRHKGWNIDLAVKSPRLEYFETEAHRDNFMREAETWVNMGLHPQIVNCYYVRTLGGIPRVFVEFLEGGSLKEWIDDHRLYTGGPQAALERILDVAIQFAWGLDYAHEQGLVHQDVKPANVMMTGEGLAKVTDFGLAKARAVAGEPGAEISGRSILVSAGGMTPAYCSPEQAAGQPLSGKTDVWSWGVSVLEMLAGEVTWFSGQAAPSALESYLVAGVDDTATPPIPAALVELLRRCFKWQPSARPATMGEIASVLQGIYSQETGQPYPRERPRPAESLADSLNNQAASLVDLGRNERAEALWEQALQADPQHTASIYNWGLARWRSGRLADDVLVQQLEGARGSHDNGWLEEYLLGMVHLERADLEAGISMLEVAAQRPNTGSDVGAALDRARWGSIPAARLLRTFEGHTGGVRSVSFSPDGRYALSGSDDKTLRLWEVASGILLRSFAGHTSWVTSVSFSPDGRYALSGGMDKTLRLWEVKSGRLLRTFEGHTVQVRSVAFSPDGRSVLSASGDWQDSTDKTLRLWEVASGRLLRTFEGHTREVSSVTFSPDGRYALSGSDDRTLRLWDVASGRLLRTFEGHTSPVTSVSFSPDGRFALSTGGGIAHQDYTVRLWEVASGRLLRTFEGHTGGVNSARFSPDGRYALSGSLDQTLRLWEVANGRLLRTFEGHTDIVESVSFSPDGRCALSGSWDKTLRLWDLPHEFATICPRFLSRPGSYADTLGLETRASRLLSDADAALEQGHTEQALQLVREARALPGHERTPRSLQAWTTLSALCRAVGIRAAWSVRTFEGHTHQVNSVSFSPDGRFALSGSLDHTLRLWEVASGSLLGTGTAHTEGVSSVSFSPDGYFFLSAAFDDTLRLWEAATGRLLRTFEGHTSGVNSITFSPDGWYALSGSNDRTLRLWEVASGRLLRTFEGHTGRVSCVSFSPDERCALSAAFDDTLRLWEVASGRLLRIFEGHTGGVMCASFSPDGRFAISGGVDATLRLWEVASGRLLRTFEGHTSFVMSVSFSPDGRYALSGGMDKTLRLWDVARGRLLRTFEGHKGYICSVTFSPDGRYVLLGGNDRTLRLWEFDWDLEARESVDWNEGTRPYLQSFLALHTPCAVMLPVEEAISEDQLRLAFTRRGRPSWSEDDFQGLITRLQHAGYGWLRPEGVRAELKRMAQEWAEPPAFVEP